MKRLISNIIKKISLKAGFISIEICGFGHFFIYLSPACNDSSTALAARNTCIFVKSSISEEEKIIRIITKNLQIGNSIIYRKIMERMIYKNNKEKVMYDFAWLEGMDKDR